MTHVTRLTALGFLLTLATMPAAAVGPPEPGVVTIHSGGTSIELQRSHAWNIQRISYRGVELGSPTGAYGALISVPATGGWIGGIHTIGGIEDIEEIALTVDGEAAALENGANYSGQLIVLHKRSRLDVVRLDATLTLQDGRITQRHNLTADEDVVVTTAYPFMFCVTAATTDWLALTSGGDTCEGTFSHSNDLDWRDDWEWTAAFIRGSRTGILLRHLSRPDQAGTATGYWDQERHHKLYVRWDSQQTTWREGYSLTGEVTLQPFTAPPAGWQEVARHLAGELVAE